MNVSVPDPPAPEVEVENPEAATTNASEANDVVMADANVELEPTSVPEANEATAVEANEATTPEANEATAPDAPVV